jgi:hypothetical protein
MIILSEGRVNMTLILFTTLLIFLSPKINFLRKLILFLFIIISSIIVSITINNLKIKKETRFENIKISKTFENNLNIFFQNDVTAERFGRFQKWKDLLEYSSNSTTKTIFLGKGPEIDREILTNLGYKWNADSANSFIYSFLCGGLVGFIFYLAIVLLLINNLRFFFKSKKYLFETSSTNIFFSIFPIMLLLRSFFENSIASWSLDFIIFATCLHYFYLQKTD